MFVNLVGSVSDAGFLIGGRVQLFELSVRIGVCKLLITTNDIKKKLNYNGTTDLFLKIEWHI